MENQHRKITGYRELSEEEISLMNQAKELSEQCGNFINVLELLPGLDQRSLALGKTNLQQGFMWVIRSIAQPTSF